MINFLNISVLNRSPIFIKPEKKRKPFSGLDPLNVRRIESLLVELNQRLGLTLIVTSHHLPSALRMAHQLVFLIDGAAVSGPPHALLASDDVRVREFLEAESAGDSSQVAAPETAS